MSGFANNIEFDKEEVYKKLADLSSELEEERAKSNEERSLEKEREILYAQMIQGLKLGAIKPNISFY